MSTSPLLHSSSTSANHAGVTGLRQRLLRIYKSVAFCIVKYLRQGSMCWGLSLLTCFEARTLDDVIIRVSHLNCLSYPVWPPCGAWSERRRWKQRSRTFLHVLYTYPYSSLGTGTPSLLTVSQIHPPLCQYHTLWHSLRCRNKMAVCNGRLRYVAISHRTKSLEQSWISVTITPSAA